MSASEKRSRYNCHNKEKTEGFCAKMLSKTEWLRHKIRKEVYL